MALITIGTNLIDVADVALVAPSGSTCTVYLADGQQLESALTAAAQAAAVNATAAGTLLTTVVSSTNYGACYISGPNTQRVLEDGAGTRWFLRGGPGVVVCPSTDLAAAQTLISVAAPAGAPYYAAGTWTPVVTNPAGNTVAVVRKSYVRIGAGPGAASGDYVALDLVLQIDCDDADVTPGCVLTLPPGFTIGGGGATALINALNNNDGSTYETTCSAGETTPGSVELFLSSATLSDVQILATIRVVYFVA